MLRPTPPLKRFGALLAGIALVLVALPALTAVAAEVRDATADVTGIVGTPDVTGGDSGDPDAGRTVTGAGAGIDAVPSPVRAAPQPTAPDLGDRVAEEPATVITGWASWYGPGFAGRRTASGEIYDPSELVAAHKTLPFDTRVRVTNQRSGRSVVVRITDRGPYVGGRIIDLSAAAADAIGMRGAGTAPVAVEIL